MQVTAPLWLAAGSVLFESSVTAASSVTSPDPMFLFPEAEETLLIDIAANSKFRNWSCGAKAAFGDQAGHCHSLFLPSEPLSVLCACLWQSRDCVSPDDVLWLFDSQVS